MVHSILLVGHMERDKILQRIQQNSIDCQLFQNWDLITVAIQIITIQFSQITMSITDPFAGHEQTFERIISDIVPWPT